MRILSVCACLLIATAFAPAKAGTAAVDVQAIVRTLGRTGQMMPGGVYRVGFPRADLHVTLDGVAIRPGLALGSYAVFMASGGRTVMMGDLVLLPQEITPVIDALERGGVRMTALHNHLPREQPHLTYLHYMGVGEAPQLANVLKSALSLTKTPLAAPKPKPAGTVWFQRTVERALSRTGKISGGVLSFSIPRAAAERMDDMMIPPAMGTGEVLNFQDAGGGRVASAGDFSLTADEVETVTRALRSNGIEVTALHSHMLGDQSHLYYMHFWAVGPPQKVAAGLRAALDRVKI